MTHDDIEIILFVGGAVATFSAYILGWRRGWRKAIEFEQPFLRPAFQPPAERDQVVGATRPGIH